MPSIPPDPKVLVILHNRPFFGAYVVHIPFLVMLRKKYSNASLIGVTKASGGSFLVDMGFLDALEIEEKKSLINLKKKHTFIAGYNLRPSSIASALGMFRLGIGKRVGFKKFGGCYTHTQPLNISIYRADLFLSLLGDISTLDAAPHVKKNIASNSSRSRKIIIAPGAGGADKKWPLSHYMSLASQIIDSNLGGVIFLTGPQEEEEKINLLNAGFDVMHNPSVNLLFEIISNCKVFVSNDCGPSHIAHVMGVNQVVIFKSYLPEWFLERSNSVYLTSAGGLKTITPELVRSKVAALISRC
ncbi:glycosyltransferase family 9 protein [Halomonas sp. BMC6]|uniref:glycosyltransferase family 9 protein n=1 Tax=Halomonas sp. BMC6 TaxID=3073244 RepID=UPI0030CE9E89